MKKIILIFLSLTHLSLLATVGDRYHSCQSEEASLTFAESSFLDEPVVSFTYEQKSKTWSGADIDILSTSADSGSFVDVNDAEQQYPITLYFFAVRPDDSAAEFHHYEMFVHASDLKTEVTQTFYMKCFSQKVHLWPTNLATLQ